MTNKPPQSYNPDKEETEYAYNYNRFIEISDKLKYPMVESVFLKQSSLINNVWVEKVVTLLLRIHSNQTIYDVAIDRKPFSSLLLLFDLRFSTWLLNILTRINNDKFLKRLYNWIIYQLLVSQIKAIKAHSKDSEVPKSTSAINAPETPTSLLSIKDYQNLFQIIYLPTIAYQAEQDKVFAAQRVAGANPLVIEELHSKLKKEFEKSEESKQLEEQLEKLLQEKFPITNEQYKSIMCCNDTLETAFGEHRLYVTDYKVLGEIVPGTVTMEKKKEAQKYIYDPISLFAIEPGNCPNRRLVPIAIRCYQNLTPNGHPNPLFIAPSIESSEAERWAWQIAKLTVQIADANYHEFISHLGGTHLRMEPIAISIYRKLPKEHPLGALLRPHIEGTLFINDAAVSGLLIWDAIYDWVSNYLKLFYADDGKDSTIDTKDNSWLQNWIADQDSKIAVTDDRLLQDWIEDLTASEGGQMTGIGQKTGNDPATIPTLDELIKTVTSIVFTSSAQHAAVNFPQSSLMTYMPNMPLAGYRKAPSTTEGISEQDYLNLLPPLYQAEIQMNMTHLLGSVHYTTLGDYHKYDKEYFKIFGSRPVGDKLKEFQEKLREIELKINERNEIRPIHYDFLLPSKIPQSINI
jgi:arachidonate 15-lipoxygenase